jgi:hypothetical protein
MGRGESTNTDYMKKIITTILLLMPLFVMAQTAPPIVMGSKLYEFRNGLRADSAFFIPRKDTLFFDNTLKAPGMLTWRPADSTIYVYRGDRWLSIFSPEELLLDSLYARWDSIRVKNNIMFSLDTARRSFDSRYQKFTLRAGQRFFGFGDSFTVGSGATVPTTNGYIYLLKERTGTTMTNYGRSGGGVVEMFHQGTTNLPDTLNSVPMTVLCGFNDAIRGGGDPREQAKINAGFRAFIANAFLKTAVAANQVAKYGTWVNVAGIGNFPIKANDIGSGGGLGVVNVIANDSLVWNFSGDNLVIGYINNDATAAGFTIGNFEVFVDGISQGIYTGNNKSLSVIDSHWSNTYSNNAVVLTGLGVGSHRVRLVHNDANNIYIDYFGTLMAPSDCPPMLIGSIPQLDSAGYSTHIAYPPSDSTFELCSQQIQAAISEFVGYPITYIDVNRWFSSEGIGVDNTHPNDTGHQQLANAFMEVIDGGKTILDPWISTDNKKQIMLVGLNAHYDNNVFSRITTGKKSSSAVYNIDDTHPIAFGIAAHNDIGVSGYLLKLFHDGRMSIATTPGYDVDKEPSATFQVNGSFATKTRMITGSTVLSDYALLTDDHTVLIATTGNLRDTVTLPAPDSTKEGRIYCVINNRNTNVISDNTYLSDSAATLNYFPRTAITWLQCVKQNTTTFLWVKTNNVLPATVGTVESVALSLPSIFSVTGSPVTTSGTLSATLATQTANTIFSGPSSGSAAAPTFRSLVGDDIPSLDAGKTTTGLFSAGRLATGTGTSANFFRGDQTLTNELLGPLVLSTTAGSQFINQYNGSNYLTISTGSTGTTTYTLTGTSPVNTFPQQVNTTGGISTSSSTTAGNFYAPGLGTAAATTAVNSLYGGGVLVAFRTVLRGTTPLTLTANEPATNLLVGSVPWNAAATGTHYVIAGAVIRQPLITPSTSTITNTANLYLNTPSRVGVNNYLLLADTGNVRVNDTLYAGTARINTLHIDAAPVVATGTYSYQNLKLNSSSNKVERYTGEFVEYVTLSTASTTLGTAEYYINNTDVARTIIVPVATGDNDGRRYTIINSSNDTAGGAISENISIDVTTNSVRVNGLNSDFLVPAGQSVTIVSNGVQWYKH